MPKKMRRASDLSHEAKWGKLTPEEIAYVEHKLQDKKADEDEDLDTWIFIVGRLGLIRHRPLLEKFLYHQTEPWVCMQALKALCTYWEYTKDYLKELKMFIRGVEWDPHDDIRLWALSIAGDFLKENYDPELLQLVLDVFENLGKLDSFHEHSTYAREFIRSCAFNALAIASGEKYQNLPDTDDIENCLLNSQMELLDLSVLEKARQRLKQKF
ncbi:MULTISPECIES: hypothetical protein [unclassified Neochlamydia]|uniref:hypothetical protein n=1 Tax=unclassified Neochlamydia TaxID=2643326 RepID=UPI00140BE806|nr:MULTISPECIES: hypothetical protein [unclassified Neochlamydia]MBS4167184.1 Uncharacterized protein [Neochlamydia sp. AcF65]MBS4171417.1 Uncharacterized protein [Neochlamydia sp. AcF95]